MSFPRPIATSSTEQSHVRISGASSALLDAFRAGAASLVVAAHVVEMWFHKGLAFAGALGVATFFLLSGFLITQSILSRIGDQGPTFPRFLADRIARIMTPYIPALIIIAALDYGLVPQHVGEPGLSKGPFAFLANLFMLQDYPAFQALDVLHHPLSWRFRPYNTGEPLWTVAVEFWTYVVVGLLFFWTIRRERLRLAPVALLACVSVPVVIWNAAGGSGKSLSLIWALGALAGYALFNQTRTNSRKVRVLAGLTASAAVLALVARAFKAGFDPYDLQTASLLALMLFSAVAVLNTVRRFPAIFGRTSAFLASYSYSLYLIHNTILWIFHRYTSAFISPVAAAVSAVVASHIAAYVLYVTFERNHRTVSRRLRPVLARLLCVRVGQARQVPQQPPAEPPQQLIS